MSGPLSALALFLGIISTTPAAPRTGSQSSALNADYFRVGRHAGTIGRSVRKSPHVEERLFQGRLSAPRQTKLVLRFYSDFGEDLIHDVLKDLEVRCNGVDPDCAAKLEALIQSYFIGRPLGKA